MADANSYTINVDNKRKKGAVDVTISQPGKETITKTVDAGTTEVVEVYPGKDALVVTAKDCTRGEKITVISESHPDQSKTKDQPPYKFEFTLDIPSKNSRAQASEDNVVVVDDEGNTK